MWFAVRHQKKNCTQIWLMEQKNFEKVQFFMQIVLFLLVCVCNMDLCLKLEAEGDLVSIVDKDRVTCETEKFCVFFSVLLA